MADFLNSLHTADGMKVSVIFRPYPGYPSALDFMKFYEDEHTLFAHDLNGLYLK